jgi:hypothetical protein
MAAREREQRDETEDRVEAPAARAQAAPAPGSAAEVLSLQRSAGNYAVAAKLARQPDAGTAPVDAGVPPAAGTPPVSTPASSYDDAMRERRWEDAARALGAMDPAERQTRINAMTTVQLVRVSRGAEAADMAALRDELAVKLREPQHAANVPTAELEDDLDEAMRRSDWTACVIALHRLPDAARTRRLGAMHLEELTSIASAAVTMPAEYAATRTAIEARRVEKLGQEYDAALAAMNWVRAVTLLNAYNDTDMITRARALTAAQSPLMETTALMLIPVLGDRVYRTIRFARNDPGVAATHPPEYAVTTPGVEAHHAAVGGGDVRVRTGVQAQIGGTALPEAYEMEYTGPDSGRTRWLQFIHREIYREEDWWPDYYLDDAITTSGGSYSLTTDSSNPNYNTDSAPGSATPFYEAGFADLRGPTTTTMLDMPGAMTHLVKREFDRGADKITSRARFSTYLVRDMQVLYRVDLTVQWVFERATHYNTTTKAVTTPPRTQTVDSARAVTALDPRMRRRLVTQWPAYNYLP